MYKFLDVILVISNQNRYRRRWELFRQCYERLLREPNVRVTVVELAFGDRPHEVTEADNPRHVQVRTNDELWHKENLFNIGRIHVPGDAEYICMVDADTLFMRHDWVQETIHKLQHFPIVQMFSHALMLGPKDHPESTHESFAYAYRKSIPSFDPKRPASPLPFGEYGKIHFKTGLAWAYRRETLDALGGLLDMCIIGSADWHMAASFMGMVEASFPVYAQLDECKAYKRMIESYAQNAYEIVQGQVGYVDGTLAHYYHGSMADRRYGERWAITKVFNPDIHLTRDYKNHGLLQWTPLARRSAVSDQLREYFELRQEDDIY